MTTTFESLKRENEYLHRELCSKISSETRLNHLVGVLNNEVDSYNAFSKDLLNHLKFVRYAIKAMEEGTEQRKDTLFISKLNRKLESIIENADNEIKRAEDSRAYLETKIFVVRE